MTLLRRALARLPLVVADVLAWGIAWLWWWVIPIRRREAAEAVRACLAVPPGPVLRRMMHDLALGYVELLQIDRPGAVEVTFEGLDALPEGAIVLAGHGGAFEIAMLRFAERRKVAAFVRTPSARWARELMERLRAEHGLRTLNTGAGMEAGYAALGEGYTLLFIQDQRHAKGILSPFFGRPARTSAALAAAHLRTGRPIWGVWQWREGRGKHRVRFEPLAIRSSGGERAQVVQEITDEGNEWYASHIRRHPHGWLWLHRRWR